MTAKQRRKQFKVAIDFDHTLYDTLNNVFIDGARDAICAMREAGFMVIIHSCNDPIWVQTQLDNADIRFDLIWGTKSNHVGKVTADVYLDDRGLRFEGSWPDSLIAVMKLHEEEV